MIAFLTPTGRESETANHEHEIPVVSLSWNRLQKAISVGAEHASVSEFGYFLKSFIQHIKEDVVGDSTAKELVKELYRDANLAQTLRRIEELRPRLSDISDQWLSQVGEFVKSKMNSDIEVSRFPPERGELREVKVRIKHWLENGIPLVFIFYCYSEKPAVRVFIWKDDYEPNKSQLNRLASSGGDEIAEEFPAIPDWNCWRLVFKEANYPNEKYINDWSFSETTLKSAYKLFVDQIEILRPLVNHTLLEAKEVKMEQSGSEQGQETKPNN